MDALIVLALLAVVVLCAALTYTLIQLERRTRRREMDEAMGNQHRRPVRGNPAEVVT